MIIDSAAPPATDGARTAALRQAAVELEAAFLAEMLKSAGLDGRDGAFGGGVGEDQFASYLADAQARNFARNGGIGLAEAIFRSLEGRADAPR